MEFIGLVILALFCGIASAIMEENGDCLFFRMWNALNILVIMVATGHFVAQKCL